MIFFTYVALISPLFPGTGAQPWKAWALAAAVLAALSLLTRLDSRLRDWFPILFTMAAYREMDWFTPVAADHHLENTWIVWDRWLLDGMLHGHGLRAAVESTGVVLPGFLELFYLLVYGVAPVALGILIALGHRERANQLWLAYLAGTLGAYALLPYFPSQPPRTVFPAQDFPTSCPRCAASI